MPAVLLFFLTCDDNSNNNFTMTPQRRGKNSSMQMLSSRAIAIKRNTVQLRTTATVEMLWRERMKTKRTKSNQQEHFNNKSQMAALILSTEIKKAGHKKVRGDNKIQRTEQEKGSLIEDAVRRY